MPDITMCTGGDCPKKEDCYRYKAKPSYLQTYFVEVPYDTEKQQCDAFWDNKPREEKNSETNN